MCEEGESRSPSTEMDRLALAWLAVGDNEGDPDVISPKPLFGSTTRR